MDTPATEPASQAGSQSTSHTGAVTSIGKNDNTISAFGSKADETTKKNATGSTGQSAQGIGPTSGAGVEGEREHRITDGVPLHTDAVTSIGKNDNTTSAFGTKADRDVENGTTSTGKYATGPPTNRGGDGGPPSQIERPETGTPGQTPMERSPSGPAGATSRDDNYERGYTNYGPFKTGNARDHTTVPGTAETAENATSDDHVAQRVDGNEHVGHRETEGVEQEHQRQNQNQSNSIEPEPASAGATEHSTVADQGATPIEHHHVHHVVQPVTEKQTTVPHRIHTTIPIQHTTHSPPVLHAPLTHAPVSLSEYERRGGKLHGGQRKAEDAVRVLQDWGESVCVGGERAEEKARRDGRSKGATGDGFGHGEGIFADLSHVGRGSGTGSGTGSGSGGQPRDFVARGRETIFANV
ncbi:hypothetical protein D9615_007139 [Tricholomella constricta]|uniref:Uncharacterized protein n=1 Tax=Tricholomella constricta TaxID=117010 RepID=A0A8H5H856_9AGAR|nr:hypothetical protein D9615_007139 [Tricholomella constricta]